MRTTLTLPDDVYQAARTLARGSGKTLSEVVCELVRRGLRPSAPRPAGADDLPTFVVSPQAAVIPGDRAAALLADERVGEVPGRPGNAK